MEMVAHLDHFFNSSSYRVAEGEEIYKIESYFLDSIFAFSCYHLEREQTSS